MKNKPKLFKGGVAIDIRGSVSFNNGLELKKVKRFYIVENNKKNFVRAWHGHKVEAKYMMCINGTAKIAAVKINNFKKPSKKVKYINGQLIAKNQMSFIFPRVMQTELNRLRRI